MSLRGRCTSARSNPIITGDRFVPRGDTDNIRLFKVSLRAAAKQSPNAIRLLRRKEQVRSSQ